MSLDAAVLLRVHHAVARVLDAAADETDAYPALAAAIGAELGWAGGTVWLPGGDELDAWPEPARRAFEEGRAIVASGAVAFPLGHVGAMTFAGAAEPDPDLLATLAGAGTEIALFAERCRSEARRRAMLDVAFDSVVTMDHRGLVLAVNRAAERTFGYREEEMVGREVADLIIPPGLRDAHRRGLARHLERGGGGPVVGRRVELSAMRADGREFPVELVVTRPHAPGPPV